MAGVATMISSAMARPCLSAVGTSCWQSTPSSTRESWARTWSCWFVGKTSMTRFMVCAHEFVCSVPSVRWPVSAMVSAAAMVSRSRISPTSTTSGSWRRMYLSAVLKECVSENTSRWFTRHFLWLCRNSMGSSIVMMWSWRSELILSIIAASVVDLPEPVGPGHEDEPLGPLRELLDDRREVQLVEGADLDRDDPDRAAHRPALPEHVAAEARQSLEAEGEVELVLLLELLLLRLVEDAVGEALRVLGCELLELAQGRQLAVHTNLWKGARRDVQVGGAALDHRRQQVVHRGGHRRASRPPRE